MSCRGVLGWCGGVADADRVGNSAFPPARYLAPLCHQYWPSEDTLPKIRDVPILFISGLRDEIVP